MEQNLKISKFFDYTMDLFCIADNKGRFLKVNKGWESVLGYSFDDLKKSNFMDFVHPDDIESTLEAIERLPRQESVEGFINRLRCSDGSYRYLEWKSYPAGKLIYAAGRDITGVMDNKRIVEESKDNFLRFFNTIDDLIMVLDSEGKMVYFNHAVESKLGYSREELLKMHVLEFHPPQYRKEAAETVDKMLKSECDYCPLPLMRKDGSYMPAETRVWIGKWGGKDCIYGLSKDLSSQQAALDKFHKLFDYNPALMAVSKLPSREFVEVNEAFIKKIGYSRDEIIGKTSSELNLFVEISKENEVALKLQKDSRIEDVILKIRQKNGQIIHGMFSGEVIDNQGEESFLTVMTDISEIIESREKLKLQTKLFEKLASFSLSFSDVSPDNIEKKVENMLKECGKHFRVDRSYVFLFSNDKTSVSNTNEWCADKIVPQKNTLQNISSDDMEWWIAILSRLEPINIPDIKEMPPEAESEKTILEAQSIKSLLAVPMIFNKELIGFFGFDSVKNKRKWTEEEISVLLTLGAIVSHAIIRCRLETENVISRNHAQMANAAKDLFLANASHELRTPLSGITGFTELLEKTKLTPEQNKYIQNVKLSTRILLLLINDVLDIERIEAGKLKLLMGPFNLHFIIKSVLEGNNDNAKKKGLDLSASIGKGIPKTLVGDGPRLEQVLNNLVGNSIKYTNAGSIKLTVNVTRSTDTWVELYFEVEDSGIGIPDDIKNTAFKPFVQADSSFTRKHDGLGLGLPICKSIIEEMNGKISIKSRIDTGTTIFFNVIFQKIKVGNNEFSDSLKAWKDVLNEKK